MHKVLKAFDYAHDGINSKHLTPGDDIEVRAELVEGLKADGYIGDTDDDAEEEVAPVTTGKRGAKAVTVTTDGNQTAPLGNQAEGAGNIPEPAGNVASGNTAGA